MKHPIALTLEMLDESWWGYHVRLTVENRSKVRLLNPYPRITEFRFGDLSTFEDAGWYLNSLDSTIETPTFVTAPGEAKSIDFHVRPCRLQPEESEQTAVPEDYDYRRFCVALSPGRSYLVWYQWEVNTSFFDGDSHWRFPQLEAVAREENATVWRGRVLSNRIRVIYFRAS